MIGIDITSIDRIDRLIQKYDQKALKRFLNAEEIELVKSSSTAAGFWAVKEATSKALGCGIGKTCGFHDIKISKTKKNAPKVKLKKRLMKKFDIKSVSVSITHDGGFAAAVVHIEQH
ncbi:holo-ACP synthase [Candidatus Marinarcus aquaticus]|uniref:Holo-[acyl-carrier-protein] synthase n=1 Tax=Candidatus Marinarcus aquaticus TaxID=2044504 RepID=A0A4Q0XP65_9BACT|nr:holo-ACP synthase [Candidatus Marinarcus aquaticus]RXJ56384.1 holo-ACP synthase [Candidatus Marinarcus aquaticus]